jgi:hypothetical protein
MVQEMSESVTLQTRHSSVTQQLETLRTENERLRATLRGTTHDRDAGVTEATEVKSRLREMSQMTARCEQARRDLAAFQAEMQCGLCPAAGPRLRGATAGSSAADSSTANAGCSTANAGCSTANAGSSTATAGSSTAGFIYNIIWTRDGHTPCTISIGR